MVENIKLLEYANTHIIFQLLACWASCILSYPIFWPKFLNFYSFFTCLLKSGIFVASDEISAERLLWSTSFWFRKRQF